MKKLGPEQQFPYNKSMRKYFIAQGQVTPKRIIQPGPNFELVQDVLAFLATCKLQEVAIKNDEARARITFYPF